MSETTCLICGSRIRQNGASALWRHVPKLPYPHDYDAYCYGRAGGTMARPALSPGADT